MSWGIGAIVVLLSGLSGPVAASEPIPFGQPLPGRPQGLPTEPATTEEAVTATFEPLDVRPGDTDDAVRVELRLPPSAGGSGNAQGSNNRDDQRANRQPQAQQPQPQQAVTGADSSPVGGWIEEAIAPAPRDLAQDAPWSGGGSTGTEAAIATLGAGPYGVYVMDDRLSTLEQVSRLSSSATFATYGNRTAIQAGMFDRQGDAIARVRELEQLGLTAEIGPVAQGAGRAIAPDAGPAAASGSGDFVDPGLFFANFNPAPSEAAPIPERAGRPPVADPDKALPLPAPPPLPTGAAPAATAEPWPSNPIPQAQTQTQTQTQTLARSSGATPAPSEAIPYAIRLVGNAQQFAQWQASLRRAGIPEDNTAILNDNGTAVLEVGPFLSFAIAARWRDFLRRETGQAVEVYANGWIVETDLANP
jgi:hypothetical protein